MARATLRVEGNIIHAVDPNDIRNDYVSQTDTTAQTIASDLTLTGDLTCTGGVTMTGAFGALQPAAYIVYVDGATVKAQSCLSGYSSFSRADTDLDALLNDDVFPAITALARPLKVSLIGNFTLYSHGVAGHDGFNYAIEVPEYRILDLYNAHLTLADAQNCTMIYCHGSGDTSPTEAGSVLGGDLDGNAAGQTTGGKGISLWEGSNWVFRDSYVHDTYSNTLYINGTSFVSPNWAGLNYFENLKLYTSGAAGIYENNHNDDYFFRCVVQHSQGAGVTAYGIHHFIRCHVIYSHGYSWNLPTGCDGTTLDSCDADTPHTVNANVFVGGTRIAVTNSFIHGHNVARDGIHIDGTAGDEVNRCIFANNIISGGDYAILEHAGFEDHNVAIGNVGSGNAQGAPFTASGAASEFNHNLIYT